MHIPKINLKNYLTDNFKDDCEIAEKLQKKFVNFDKVRKEAYSQLRSVDFVDVDYEDRIYLYEITTFKEQIKQMKEEKGIDSKECIKKILKAEYRAKLFESLLLLNLLNIIGISINRKQIIYKIIYCDSDKNIQKDVYGHMGFLEKYLNSVKQKKDKIKILPMEIFIKNIK